jgi:hypothetical protein
MVATSSFYKTSHSAEKRGMGHPSRRFVIVTSGNRREIYCRFSWIRPGRAIQVLPVHNPLALRAISYMMTCRVLTNLK